MINWLNEMKGWTEKITIKPEQKKNNNRTNVQVPIQLDGVCIERMKRVQTKITRWICVK